MSAEISGDVIGIDIGGTKTHGVRMSGDQVGAEAVAQGANILSAGPIQAREQLEAIAVQLVPVSGDLSQIRAVCAGAAGAGSAEACERVRVLLQGVFPRAAVRVVHDVELVLAAAGLDSGISLIAGTGSVAWGRTPAGDQARAGGWGHVLGDGGSAFGVVRSAIQHTLRLDDAGLPPDDLARTMLAAGGATTGLGLIERFYADPAPLHWAGQAQLVFALADSGDPAAVAIVTAAAADLASIVANVARRLELPGPVVVSGGLLTHQPRLLDGLRAALVPAGITEVVLLEQDPVAGAIALARDLVDVR